MSNRQKRRQDKHADARGGKAHRFQTTVGEVRAESEMVLTTTDQDIPLAMNAQIDLIAEGERVGGTPSFVTRKADPMRPFNNSGDGKAYVRGGEAAFRAYAGNDVRVQITPPDGGAPILDAVFPPGDAGREAAMKVQEVLRGLPKTARDRVVNGLFQHTKPLTMAEVSELNTLLDGMLPGENQESRNARITAAQLLSNEQRDRLRQAIKNKDEAGCAAVVAERRQQYIAQEKLTRGEAVKYEAERDDLNRRIKARNDLLEMAKAPKLQRLGETCFHKLMQAWNDGSIVKPGIDIDEPLAKIMASDVPNHAATIFVVQHDWAAAFQRATDFSEGEFRLPSEDMVFEFRISGRRTCCLIRATEGMIVDCRINVETSVGWCFAAGYTIANGNWPPLEDKFDICAPILNLCRAQVRAMCIGLEAEIAMTEIVRAPHRLNQKRERAGKLPLYDYHVVSLANRKKHLPREALPSDMEDEKRHKRLHFVRGHWVHYATGFKTWRKWHFRGDPDLGFVDKEYRL